MISPLKVSLFHLLPTETCKKDLIRRRIIAAGDSPATRTNVRK
ncbi:hypothetical protein MtrunA17_Chr4g0055711 [Medicago truncatula]|uniref:Uncharacterized protein n=1 Tax=Medicago truncatula TaxID=3880 RepID=A0A396IJU1_MEDTR|nr:hypothetical protein MtrunA17_Chr4g0055711 [Medicago truncatula]